MESTQELTTWISQNLVLLLLVKVAALAEPADRP